ncbi:DinB family protein [Nocardioides sp.]|uniref:DinB family protein n=1 Tax=Nocardioides sp. TaxID=35761 RepID=UPI0025FB4EF7|nr:DinB family protein [Nocardioides sp.]
MTGAMNDGPERAALQGFLDHNRDVLRRKCSGLSAEQLALRHPPSTMTLGGMLKHLAWVEAFWSRRVFLGQPMAEPWASGGWKDDDDWEWHSAVDDSPEDLWSLFEAEVAAADEIYAAAHLDDQATRADPHSGDRATVRWILLHLLEEYARHNGHADLIRESIDGATGE